VLVGEEAKNPSKSIPRAIVITLLICLTAYVTVSAAVTLMKPYFLLNKDAPLPDAFNYTGLGWASKPIAVGSMCALIARYRFFIAFILFICLLTFSIFIL